VKAFIGIDPGLSGGVAVIFGDGRVHVAHPLPLLNDQLDFNALTQILYDLMGHYDCHTWIEKVTAMPGQGVTSMFKFGFVTGAIHGILSAIQMPYLTVAPQAWRKVVLAGIERNKDNPKEAALIYCMREYPTVSLLATSRSKKPHSGTVDSLCIATFGYLSRLEK
jgi:crossover junction endodeoxyribonuclease RuvC